MGREFFLPLNTKLALAVFSGKIKKTTTTTSVPEVHTYWTPRMSLYFFILAHYNYFVTSTEAVAWSRSLSKQMPRSLLRCVESSKLQRTNGPFGPLLLAGMITNFVVGQELCQPWEQKNPLWGNFLLHRLWRIWTVIWSQEREENGKQDMYNHTVHKTIWRNTGHW